MNSETKSFADRHPTIYKWFLAVEMLLFGFFAIPPLVWLLNVLADFWEGK